LSDARGINDGGQIVANSCVAICKAYRLDPVDSTPVMSVSRLLIWTAAGTAILLLVGASIFRRRIRR
jgi:multisubunit Na+/H+ antiporter MnhB subunit